MKVSFQVNSVQKTRCEFFSGGGRSNQRILRKTPSPQSVSLDTFACQGLSLYRRDGSRLHVLAVTRVCHLGRYFAYYFAAVPTKASIQGFNMGFTRVHMKHPKKHIGISSTKLNLLDGFLSFMVPVQEKGNIAQKILGVCRVCYTVDGDIRLNS